MVIGVVGGKGRFGSSIYSLIKKRNEFEALVIESTQELISSRGKVDVYIDATTSEAFMQNYHSYRVLSKPIVIATTGFTPMQLKYIENLSRFIPIIKAANFSIGGYKHLKIVEYAANILSDEYNIGIIEKHNENKKDRPSGTAREILKTLKYIKPSKQIRAESIRLFDIIGEHEVYFNKDGVETIEISHRAFNRESFASGTVDAARWIIDKEKGLYSLEDMLH